MHFDFKNYETKNLRNGVVNKWVGEKVDGWLDPDVCIELVWAFDDEEDIDLVVIWFVVGLGVSVVIWFVVGLGVSVEI